MSAVPMAADRRQPAPRSRTAARRRLRVGALVLPGYAHLVILWLFLPIAVMMVFAFNDTHGKYNFAWSGFTLKWFAHPFTIPTLTSAAFTSVWTAVSASLIATALGTMLALAMHRYDFRGRGTLNAVLVMSIAASEVVVGSALLTLFVTYSVPLGYATILFAQVMFSIPFVAITVSARLAGTDPSLEEAAQDLGATPLWTFWLVTLPVIFPGVLAAALLALAVCLDDYVITSFVAGNVQTFPLWVYGATREGVPPQVNVIGTFIFLFGVVVALAAAFWRSWRARQLARDTALAP